MILSTSKIKTKQKLHPTEMTSHTLFQSPESHLEQHSCPEIYLHKAHTHTHFEVVWSFSKGVSPASVVAHHHAGNAALFETSCPTHAERVSGGETVRFVSAEVDLGARTDFTRSKNVKHCWSGVLETQSFTLVFSLALFPLERPVEPGAFEKKIRNIVYLCIPDATSSSSCGFCPPTLS